MNKKILSKGEETLAIHLRHYGIAFKREYKFHPTRRWRFDFFVNHSFGVEVEGVTNLKKGRHQTIDGYTKDCEKYNEALILGYPVFRFTSAQVQNGTAIDTIIRYLNAATCRSPVDPVSDNVIE